MANIIGMEASVDGMDSVIVAVLDDETHAMDILTSWEANMELRIVALDLIAEHVFRSGTSNITAVVKFVNA